MLYSSKDNRLLQIILLVLVTIALFCNTFANDFVWDDITLITEDQFIRESRNIPRLFAPRYWNELYPFPGQYRPIREVSLALDYFFWNLSPAGYHFTNLLLHAINVILIFHLAFIIAGPAERGGISGQRLLGCLPFLTALLFATHPIHTESINLIKNRSDLLAFMFFLISLLLFIKSLTGDGGMSRRLLIAGAWFCFIPAILSKESALTLPGVLLLYAVCFLTGPKREQVLKYLIPYGVIILIYFWFVHSFITPAAPVATGALRPADPGQQAMTVIQTLGWYFKMLAVPFPLNADHAFTVPSSLLSGPVPASLAALLLIFSLAVRAYQRSRLVLFAMGWVVLTLLPAANIIYLVSRPVAEQRLYIPSFGFCLLLAYGLTRLSRVRTARLTRRRAAIISGALAGVIASLYAAVTVGRNLDWHDTLTFYSKTIASNPDSATMHINLGTVLNKAGKYEEAISHFKDSLRLDPNIKAHYNLGITLYKMGYYDEAMGHFQAGLRLEPDFLGANFTLGVIFYEIGQYQKAIDHYQTVLRLEPDNIYALNKLGVALYTSGRYDEAVSQYQTALRLKPDYIPAHYNLGRTLYVMGRYDEAISKYQTALHLKPNHDEVTFYYKTVLTSPDRASIHNDLGIVLNKVKKYEEAISQYQKALILKPDYADACYNLGVTLHEMGRYEEAVSHYQKVLHLKPDYADAYYNLGIIFYEMGQYEKAAGHYQKVLRLQPDSFDALNNLGLALVAAGQAEEAIGYYQAALKITPADEEICYNLGTALVKLGKYREAATFFERAGQLKPDNIKARQALHECLEKMAALAGP